MWGRAIQSVKPAAGLVVLGLLAGTVATSAQTLTGLPDLKQQGFGFLLPKRGYAYCGPTAVANILLWMQHHRMSEKYSPETASGSREVVHRKRTFEVETAGRLVKTLGRYMGTNADNGTPPADLVRGMADYLRDHGRQDYQLHYHGIRPVPPAYLEREGPPDVRELIDAVDDRRFAVLNIGWYKRVNGRLARIGGHWVTFAGWESVNGRHHLVVHDPANRPYWEPAAISLRLKKIKRGILFDDVDQWSHDARGFHVLHGPINRLPGSDYALLEGAVFIEPKKRPDAPTDVAFRQEPDLHDSAQ